MQFKKDGTFSAVSTNGGQQSLLTGKYEFDGFKLRLKAPGRPERIYRATCTMGGKLTLRSDQHSQTLHKQ